MPAALSVNEYPWHSSYFAAARVALNLHQVDAALFALRSTFANGVIPADDAGPVFSQLWAGRRRLLVIVPATLRKQHRQEREDKFSLPSLTHSAETLFTVQWTLAD